MTLMRVPLFAVLALLAGPVSAGDDHPPLPTSVDAFHDIISKDWHAKEGPERLRSACANAVAYRQASTNVLQDKAPAKVDQAAWTSAVAALDDASNALGAYCSVANEGNVLAGLTTLHDRFHDLVKLIKHQ